MHPALRRILVGGLLACGALYFALVRDESSAEGLVLWTADEAAAAGAASDAAAPAPGADAVEDLAPPWDLADAPRTVRGRVLDFEGAPVGGVEVLRTHPQFASLSARTDELGHFSLELEAARGEFGLAAREWITLGGRLRIDADFEDEYLVVAAPRATVQGRVLDARGEPLVDALVRLWPPSDALVPFGIAALPIELESWRVWTNSQGGFRIDDAPAMPGVRVEIEHPTHSGQSVGIEFSDRRAQIEVRLERGG